jgi:excisionase family DNA binding protein
MVMTSLPQGPVTSKEEERPELQEAERLLREHSGRVYLTDEHGHQVELPETAAMLVHQILLSLAKGNPVEIHALPKEFTIRRAADLLDVPVAEVVRLLDSGEIPATPFGEFRRIRFEDLMVYKARRDAERREALREMTRLGQEMGGYNTAKSPDVTSSDQQDSSGTGHRP